MPPPWPRVHLCGSGFGQAASTAKVGISPACAARGSAGAPISTAAARNTEAVLERLATAWIECPRFCTGVIDVLPYAAGFPAWRAVNSGEVRESIGRGLVPRVVLS